jgi:hypothetical protein
MSGLADRIRYALANPLRDDHAIDPMRELANLLREVGLEPESGGGAVTFAGRDPIISSPLPFATMAAVALMAKAVSVADHHKVPQIVFKPDWTRHAKAAPFKRNDQMLEALPAGLVAFPGSDISANLADKARKLGIPVWRHNAEGAA